MYLHQIGELRLLKEIRERFSPPSLTAESGIIVGIGDDAAVIAPQKENTIVTTDMMNEGIHFDLSFISPYHLGFKLVSVNVSDIMAMGGNPLYLFLNIALKKDTEEGFFWDLYRGISSALNLYGVKLLGGDLCSAKNDMVLSATVIGTGDRIVTRAGAKSGDKIYVTGSLGDAACGLEILKRLTPESKNRVRSSELGVKSKDKKESAGRALFLTLNSELLTLNWSTAEPLLKRHLMPTARDCSQFIGHATAMIDISDGLFIDLCRLCDESKSGARIYLDRIPLSEEMLSAAEILGLDPFHLAAAGGEDYELLFTAPAGIEPVLNPSTSQPLKITCIGEITEKDMVIVGKNNRESALAVEGYQHFSSRQND